MKVALVHDWLVDMGGAETVLREFCSLYPDAPVYTLFSDPKQAKYFNNIINSSLQNIPFIQKLYRKLPNLFPLAIEEFDFSHVDIVLSSSHAVAKGLLTDAKTCHISYIHTPMRYIWDLTHSYLKQANFPPLLNWYTRQVFSKLRTWDIISSGRPDFLIANSHFIQQRIAKIYRRHSTVIYPPVNIHNTLYFDKQNYYVAASRHVPYKNIPLIASAFTKMTDKKLVILGDGSDSQKVKQIIKHSPNITYMGYQNREILMKTIAMAKAFIFAAEEDFGILPVEAQSVGTPVLAYGVGGAKETIIPHKTGLFFMEQNEDAIIHVVKQFEHCEDKFDSKKIIKHSQQFSQERFQEEMSHFVHKSYQEFQSKIF